MKKEKLNTGETYAPDGARRRVRIGFMAAGAAAGYYIVSSVLDRCFGRRKPNAEITLAKNPLVGWSDLSEVLPPESVKVSPIAWTMADAGRRSLERNAVFLGGVKRVNRTGAIALLGGNPAIISRARQELDIKYDQKFDAIRYEDEEGKWTTLPVEGGFQLFVPQTGGRIKEGQRREVLGAAVIPEEIGLGRVALGFDLPGGFIATPTHVAEVVNLQDYKEHYANVPFAGDIGKAA